MLRASYGSAGAVASSQWDRRLSCAGLSASAAVPYRASARMACYAAPMSTRKVHDRPAVVITGRHYGSSLPGVTHGVTTSGGGARCAVGAEAARDAKPLPRASHPILLQIDTAG